MERWTKNLVYAKLNQFLLKSVTYKRRNYYIYYLLKYIYIYDYYTTTTHHILPTLTDLYILPPILI